MSHAREELVTALLLCLALILDATTRSALVIRLRILFRIIFEANLFLLIVSNDTGITMAALTVLGSYLYFSPQRWTAAILVRV